MTQRVHWLYKIRLLARSHAGDSGANKFYHWHLQLSSHNLGILEGYYGQCPPFGPKLAGISGET